MRLLQTLILWAAGLGFLGFGLWFVVNPVAPLQAMGIEVSGVAAPKEIRAFYGGLEIALGLFLLIGSLKLDWRRPALWLVFFTNAGIGLTRLIALLMGGEWHSFFAYALIWELGFAAVALIVLKFDPERE
jgi:hypothetical protein